MSDIAEKLLARLDEVEQEAREATVGPWMVEKIGSDEAAVNPDIAAYVDCDVSYGEPTGTLMRLADATHIVRWQPEAVLRRCAADREIVELCRPSLIGVSPIHKPGTEFIEGAGEPWAMPVLTELARGYGLEVDR